MNFARLFSRFGWLSTVYYLCFNASFRREQYSVLAGRTEYARALTAASGSSALLRRNIHRLEKGLIMRPRRAVFAEDYIFETVTALQTNILALEVAEREWALQVLTQYFDTVTDRGDIIKARNIFLSVIGQGLQSEQDGAAVPYPYADLPQPRVTYPDFFRLCQRRRSVRWFLTDPVPQLLLEQAVQAATLAPSACNRQPFKFIQLSGTDAATAAGFAMGTTGFAAQIPTLLVVVGDLSAYPAERDRHVIYIDGALASMQLMLALDTLGLASCPINWPDVEKLERKMDKFLQLQPWQRPVMLIAVGYPDPTGGIPFSAKKSVVQTLVPFSSAQNENNNAD
ncbi:nitroreductase family protein [Rheinheimera sp.]|uniref:nitroreductase family protein n=1 Tax=Rheinheimera sp. TaxID=1869214 RepID=UPI003D2CF024